MPHALEAKYGLTAKELLDAVSQDLRFDVDFDRTAKLHFARKLKALAQEGWIGRYEDQTAGTAPDFTIETRDGRPIRIDVKAAKETPTVNPVRLEHKGATDPSGGFDLGIDMTAECMGTITGDWSQFRYRCVRGRDAWHSRLNDALDALRPADQPE